MSLCIDLTLLKMNRRSIGLPRGRFNELHTIVDVVVSHHPLQREPQLLQLLCEMIFCNDGNSLPWSVLPSKCNFIKNINFSLYMNHTLPPVVHFVFFVLKLSSSKLFFNTHDYPASLSALILPAFQAGPEQPELILALFYPFLLQQAG